MAATNCSDGDKRHGRPRNGAIIPYPASQREKKCLLEAPPRRNVAYGCADLHLMTRAEDRLGKDAAKGRGAKCLSRNGCFADWRTWG